MIEQVFIMIKNNAEWIFGSTSLAAIIVALLTRKKAKSETKKPVKNSSSMVTSTNYWVIGALVIVAVASGAISISDVSMTSITTGDNSTAVNARDSDVKININKSQ